jgi:hypothetical protein
MAAQNIWPRTCSPTPGCISDATYFSALSVGLGPAPKAHNRDRTAPPRSAQPRVGPRAATPMRNYHQTLVPPGIQYQTVPRYPTA